MVDKLSSNGEENREENTAPKQTDSTSNQTVLSPTSIDQLHALRAEIDQLNESLNLIAVGSARFATSQVRQAATEIEDMFKRNIILSITTAAIVGFLWGRSRTRE
ncbi:hypothetical protein JJB09_26090 [Rhizobium sp. KVB221]|uniref:DUF883 domain-containing protein n=1 Tax=Rhizobium setariae TaxID=2801340 RepID=A0A936YUQ6_9HYPH|nr:hypothetical protein [Rhizobium setariae]MBL0375482.1 hypothetical protein [Rhizobium setariae]